MGGLTTSLLTGLSALEATQAALDATSNNIANANNPGYTEEAPQFSANAETLSGNSVTGGGVTLNSIQSVRDQLLNVQIQQQTSLQQSYDTQSSSLQQLQTAFSSTGEDLASTFTEFSTSLAQLSANPSSGSVQQGVLAAGQNLVNSFHSTASSLTGTQAQADQQVTQGVAEINSLSTQIAQLNSQLAQSAGTTSGGGTIEDQRDQLVQQLAGLVGISVSQSSNGEVITTGNGSPLVMGGQSFSLQTTTGSNGMQQVLDSGGNNITSQLDGGKLGGAIQLRDQTIPGYLNQLNTLASQFATAFNSAQAAGYDSNGNPGQNFFSIAAGQGAAAGIAVAISDPSQIAVSSDGSSGSNGNVANLSATLTDPLPSGQSPANAYSSLVFNVGNDTSNATAESNAVGQNLLQLTNQKNSVSGVNIDQETTNLIRFQTAYQAAARVVSTIQALNSATMNMVS